MVCGPRCETGPVVAPFDDDRASVAEDANLDGLGGALVRLHRVPYQIAQREARSLLVDVKRLGRAGEIDANAIPRQRQEGCFDELGWRDGADFERHVAHEIEEYVGQALEPFRTFDDARGLRPQRLRELLHQWMS